MVRLYFRSAVRRPAFWCVMAILVIYTLSGYFIPNVLMASQTSTSDPILFLNYMNFFSLEPLCGLILPLYTLYMHYNHLFFNKELVLIKFKTKSSFWTVRIAMLFLNSFCFVLFLYFLFFLRCFAFGVIEEVRYFAASLFMNFFSQVLSFSFFYLLAVCLSELLHSPAIGLVLIFLLMAGDFFLQRVYAMPGILLRGMYLTLTGLSQTWLAIGITTSELAVVSFLLIYTADKRDYLPKKVS